MVEFHSSFIWYSYWHGFDEICIKFWWDCLKLTHTRCLCLAQCYIYSGKLYFFPWKQNEGIELELHGHQYLHDSEWSQISRWGRWKPNSKLLRNEKVRSPPSKYALMGSCKRKYNNWKDHWKRCLWSSRPRKSYKPSRERGINNCCHKDAERYYINCPNNVFVWILLKSYRKFVPCFR